MSIIEKFERNIRLLLGEHRVDRIQTLERKGSTRQRVAELKANYGEKIKGLMAQSKAERVEYGAMLCTESTVSPEQFARGEGSTRLGCVTRGMPYEVRVRDCHDHIHPIGTLHTHYLVEVFSAEDLLVGLHKPEMLTCLVFTRNGTVYLAGVSPWLLREYPIRTKRWISDALSQTKYAYVRVNKLAKEWGHEFESYTQGRKRFEELSPGAQDAYGPFMYYLSMINTLQPAVEKLLDYAEVEL